MRGSFVRLIVISVLACWAIGIAVVAAYMGRQTWSLDDARTDGVFLVYEMLNQAEPADRAGKLDELQPHFGVPFSLVGADEVSRRAGRRVAPGERIPHRASRQEAWFLMVFDDGRGGLTAGPVHPAIPTGVLPIGFIVGFMGLPVIVGFFALRVDRDLRKVERASEALAVGEFGTRVAGRRGPPNELAERFNAMAERIEELMRSRDELVQAVSHELGSPLSRLRFHMELLGNQPAEKRGDRLASMERELDALDGLVAELLHYVQTDDLELDRRVFDPAQGLTDLAELAGFEVAAERSVNVTVDLEPGVTVFVDQRLFLRAVENLLRNAVQHAESEVRLVLTQNGGQIRVAVHDDGPGIPEALREKVTIPFVRLDSDRGRKTGGVGLGLAIVSRIMHRHGGRLEIGTSDLGGAKLATIWPNN
jgi:signal transduction histidine kinase